MASGDAVIFQAGEFSGAARDRSQMFHWKIEACVAIKFPISRVAGITPLGAPDLPA